jgi:hypothetical protein
MHNTKQRIDLFDSPMDAVMKMVEGNPGAIAALMDLMNSSESIDPQSAFGPLSPLLSLDALGIYGSGIYVIWSDKCNRDTRRVLVLLRAVQLGLLNSSKVQEMADDQSFKINLTEEEFKDLDHKVCEQLEKFQRPAA